MPVDNTNPFFPMLYLDGPNDWNALSPLCRGFLVDRDHALLREVLGTSAKTILVELDYVDKDYRDIFANFYAKKFADYPSRTVRLHFFRNRLPTDCVWNIADHGSDYIGFAVIRPTRVTSIGRTSLDPGKIDGIHGRICLATYLANIAGSQLRINAFPFMRQSGDVTRCAHAACWMMFRYFSQKYPRYAETWPYEITQMTSDYSHGRLVPSKGITISQVSEMSLSFGFAPEIYRRNHVAHELGEGRFEELLYHCIDSGLPVVASLIEKEHAVTVCGYIPNTNRTPPTGKLIDSYAYIDALVVNDDNYLPYRALPRKENNGEFGHPEGFTIADIDAFVVPLYDKMHFPVDSVGERARRILEDSFIGLRSVGSSLDPEEVLLRVFLTTTNDFRHHWSTSHPVELARVYRSWPMYQFIWVIELSTRELYKQDKVVGEIILDATASAFDPHPETVIHYPGKLFLNLRQHDHWSERDLPQSDSYPAYRLNLAEVPKNAHTSKP